MKDSQIRNNHARKKGPVSSTGPFFPFILPSVLPEKRPQRPVSYTHLDVYKRQTMTRSWCCTALTASRATRTSTVPVWPGKHGSALSAKERALLFYCLLYTSVYYIYCGFPSYSSRPTIGAISRSFFIMWSKVSGVMDSAPSHHAFSGSLWTCLLYTSRCV